MKSYIKIFCLIISALMILPACLISCSKSEPQNSDIEEFITIISEGKSDYTLVRAEKANEMTVDAVVDLRRTFTEKFGAEPDIGSDWVKKGEKIPDRKEILIGETNRPESIQVMEELLPDTFVVKVVNDKLVIAADSTAMLINGIRYFIKEYIDTATDSIVMSTATTYVGNLEDYRCVETNPDGSTTLNLQSFVATFDSKNQYKFLRPVAEVFEEKISDYGGILGVAEDKSVNKFEILFGKCDREDYVEPTNELLFRDFSLHVKNCTLSVNAISIYGYERAIRYILECASKGDITIPENGIYSQYDYGVGDFAELRKNYENPGLEGAWMVNVCHRGDVTSNLPENSLPAYQSCLDNKIDVIETDLKLTKDGVWVICHDQTLDRTTNMRGKISDKTLKEVLSASLKAKNGGQNASVTKYKVPTLTEIIDLCKGKTLFNLDHFSTGQFQAVYDVFEKKGAVDMAMFKASGWTADQLSAWFCQLMLEDRELPLYSPLIYSNTETGLKDFSGLTSMVETAKDHTKEVNATALSHNMRLMCLTAGSPELENAQTWTELQNLGYAAIMTDEPIRLKNFIHK